MAQLLVIFATVFVAELGDKTQLATLLFAADRGARPLLVFAAATAALASATAIAVFVGGTLGRALDGVPLRLVAGIGFVAIGAWMIVEHLRAG